MAVTVPPVPVKFAPTDVAVDRFPLAVTVAVTSPCVTRTVREVDADAVVGSPTVTTAAVTAPATATPSTPLMIQARRVTGTAPTG